MVDFWSATTIPVVPYANSKALAHGTAFTIVTRKKRRFLITNYHVASGRNPNTNKPIREDGIVPDRLLFALYVPTNSGHRWKALVLPTEQYGKPTWFLHPDHGCTFDVVAIPIPQFRDQDAIYAVPLDHWPNIAIHPSSDVAIIGFPEGISGPGAFPLWKTGGVASEPELKIPKENYRVEEDYFWIDSNTRSGMSGAPVIARRFGFYVDEGGGSAVGSKHTDRLLGVYAGRALDARDVTLGRVWRLRGVKAIIDHAESKMQNNGNSITPWRIGLYPNLAMPTLENKQLTPKQNGKEVSSPEQISDIILVILNSDQRFGLGLDRVRLAAELESACFNAKSSNTSIEVNPHAASVLLEALNQPIGWAMPSNWKSIIGNLEWLVEKLSEVATK